MICRALLRFAACLALALIAAGPAAAYTIYLKNGDTPLIAEKKYEVRGDKAYIVLQSGTVTSIELAQIDIERTEEANARGDYGTAFVLGDEKTQEVPVPQARQQSQQTLADLIQAGAAGPASRREERPEPAPGAETPSGPTVTPAGYPDLLSLPRRPPASSQLAEALSGAFQAQELPAVRVFSGSAAGRPLVEVTTGSERAVERALVVAALSLVQLADRYPQALQGLELLMVTPDGARAGQFQLTPEMASLLTTRRMDIDTFFVRYVQF